MPRYSNIVAILCGILILCTLQIANGQANPAPQPKFPDRKFLDAQIAVSLKRVTMEQVITALAGQSRLSFLVDGEPNGNVTTIEFAGSVRSALDRLGETFDYDWTLTKSDVVLLRKRFTVRGERPQIHVREMQQLMKDMIVTFSLAPKVEHGDPRMAIINHLARTLTQEQVDMLGKGQKVSAASLRPDQLEILRTAILASTFGDPEEKLDYYAPFIANMENSYFVVKEVPSAPAAGAAQVAAPQRDYVFVVRDKNKKLITHYLVEWSGGN